MLDILILVALLAFSGVQTAAAEPPDVLLVKGFWFADGFLLAEPAQMDWQVIAKTPVKLYTDPSLASAVAGELSPGVRARIQNIAFAAYPGRQIIRATEAVTSSDGKVSLQPGDEIRLVCYQGDAMAAYVGDEMVLVDLYGLKLGDQVRSEWRERLGGLNQWLQLSTPDGKIGWAQFFDPATKSPRGRWQQQPHAAGGSHNFNVIVFSEEMPHFRGAHC